MIESLRVMNWVEVIDAGTRAVLFEGHNTVSAAGKKLVMDFLEKAAVSGIQVIAVCNASGEVIRKGPQSTTAISDTKTKFTFYLTESEGNTTITQLKLCADTATTTLNTGIDFATVNLNLTKTETQSLLINWTVEVV